jgi:nuclear pore complex protein Nup188
MMAAIHGDRLTLLLSLLELLWFSTDHKASEAKSFMVLVKHLPALLTNPAQYPPSCMLNRSSVPFHRTLLQILYFCVRQCRSYLLNHKAKILTAEHRLAISSMVDTALNLTVGGLRVVFDGARSGLDLDLDKDMELLVVVFEQCTRPDISPSSTYWLGRCQEHDVIGASLRVFVEHDLIGLGHLSVLQSLNRPLYTSHILAFHMTLASVPTAAEVLASAGVITAYCNNRLSPAIRAANIATTIPELPGTRSPAHSTWCAMLAVVAGVLSALGRHNHFLDQEATSFVQLYGDQITQALSWTIGDSLTLPLVEEIEQSIHLFNAIVESQPFAARSSQSGNTEPILRAFAGKALVLLQQLNYALTHPNHLVSLVEAVTMEERTQLERDASESLSNTVDLTKRPFLTRLIHRLFGLSGSVLSTLASIGGAELVLTGDHEDWPLSKALVVPVCYSLAVMTILSNAICSTPRSS